MFHYLSFTLFFTSFSSISLFFFFFFFNDTATTEIYTLSLHDALPISAPLVGRFDLSPALSLPLTVSGWKRQGRSEEHTSELQSRFDLVCRLLLEKKKKKKINKKIIINKIKQKMNL